MKTFPVIQSRRLGQRPIKVIWQGTPIVLFRDDTGTVNAFHDTCPHLDTSLSEGWVKDGRLVCPWHQWEFATDGQCQHPVSMSRYQCQVFKVHECHDWIWVGATEPHYHSERLSLSKMFLVMGHTLKDWTHAGLIEDDLMHVRIKDNELQCDIRIYVNQGTTESHYRVGIWYPRTWAAEPNRAKIADIMDSVLTHLNAEG